MLQGKSFGYIRFIDININNGAQGNWTRLRHCYWKIERDIYKLYDLDSNIEVSVRYHLGVYDIYDESEMGKTWGEVLILAEEIKKYFKNEVLRIINIKRTSG